MDIKKAEKIIKVKFKDKDLLQTAFTHRSYLNENKGKVYGHNERLEFLGDAVLELVVTEFLFQKFPKKNEGDLTAFRASLVNTNTLSKISTKLGFNEFLLLSRGESKDTGRARNYILANTFESVVGAIYLDQGYDVVKKFISDNLLQELDEILEKGLWLDAKSKFQEKAQELLSFTPAYETIHEEGPDHDKNFMVIVSVDNKEVARGKGKSKQEAEQSAARAALEKKGWL